MGARFQKGHLRCRKRTNGTLCWEFMWREPLEHGRRVRRTAVIGSIEDYPTQELAQAAASGLRMHINEERNRLPQQTVLVADLIDHYLDTELAAAWHSHATRLIYREFLLRWIKPHWSSFNIKDVRTVAVESWLRQLRRRDGEDLANSTKAKIRNVMSVSLQSRYTLRMARARKKSDYACPTERPTKIHSTGVRTIRGSMPVVKACESLSCHGAVGCHDWAATQ